MAVAESSGSGAALLPAAGASSPRRASPRFSAEWDGAVRLPEPASAEGMDPRHPPTREGSPATRARRASPAAAAVGKSPGLSAADPSGLPPMSPRLELMMDPSFRSKARKADGACVRAGAHAVAES